MLNRQRLQDIVVAGSLRSCDNLPMRGKTKPKVVKMPSTLERADKFKDVLSRFGGGSYDKSFWKEVKETIDSEHERYKKEERKRSPKPSDLHRYFSM